MIYDSEIDCPNNVPVPGKEETTTEVLMKIPIDRSMENVCRLFDVGTLFKKKKSKGFTINTANSNIGADLVFDTEPEFLAWDKALVEAQEMNQSKGTWLKQAKVTLKREYSHEYEETVTSARRISLNRTIAELHVLAEPSPSKSSSCMKTVNG